MCHCLFIQCAEQYKDGLSLNNVALSYCNENTFVVFFPEFQSLNNLKG